MAEFPALPIWTDAYLGDTIHLTTIEHGAYLLLLMAMWRNGGTLPDDDKLLAKYARLTMGQWVRISPTIRAFFKTRDGSISQGRLTDELIAVRQHSKRQSDRVKSRWLKTNETDNIPVLPDDTSGNTPLPLPITTVVNGGGGYAREAEKPTFREQILTACRVDPVSGLAGPNGKRIGTQADMYEAARWTDDLGLTEAECLAEIVAVVAAKRDGPPTSFRYFEKAMARLSAAKHAPPLQPDPTFQPRGPKPNERAAFDRAINQIADGLSAGTIHIDNSNRDPFAVRRG